MKIAGVVFAAALLGAGCASECVVVDRHNPELAVTRQGGVTWRGEFVRIVDVPDLLDDAGYTRKDTINIRIPDEYQDYRVAYALMRHLVTHGYSRPVLVSERKAVSEVTDPKKRKKAAPEPRQPAVGAKRKIRYKN